MLPEKSESFEVMLESRFGLPIFRQRDNTFFYIWKEFKRMSEILDAFQRQIWHCLEILLTFNAENAIIERGFSLLSRM